MRFHTLCEWHPDGPRPPQPAVAVPPTSRRTSLRSAPASSSLTVQPFGWGPARRPWGRASHRAQSVFRRCSRPRSCRSAPRHRRLFTAGEALQRSSQGSFPPSMTRSSDAGTFLCPCSDPVRIRQNPHPCGGVCEVATRPDTLRCLVRWPRSTFRTGLGISCGKRGWSGRT